MENIKELEKSLEFECILLSRLIEDCKYYLGNGNKSKKWLWAKDEKAQIEKMKDLYNAFPEGLKPDWITLAEIKEYESKMLEV